MKDITLFIDAKCACAENAKCSVRFTAAEWAWIVEDPATFNVKLAHALHSLEELDPTARVVGLTLVTG